MVSYKTGDPDKPLRRDHLDDLYNPSRAFSTLRSRGFVTTRASCLSCAYGVALQPTGLVAARSLGLPDSEIVDLDRLTEQLEEAATARSSG
jgi:hypothetical protein